MASALKLYLQEAGQYELLTAEQEIELARKYRDEGDEAARELLICSNLRLVVNIAKNYNNKHLELMDLINEGNLGLITAVEKYNPDLGYRFSTCATPWIKQAISKAIIDQGKSIRIPAHIYQLLSKYRQAVAALTTESHNPTEEEIAKYMKIDVEKVKNLIAWKQDTVSLSTPLGDEGEDTLEDLQADTYSETPMEYTFRKAKEEKIQSLLAQLKPRTQTIMKLRFGLGNDADPEEFKKEHTLEEVGAYVKLTRERVRQIVNETLKDLRAKWDGSF